MTGENLNTLFEKDQIKLKKIKDTRVHLSDRLIRGLPIKNKQYSKGDDTVIGLRIYVFPGGSKVFWFNYTERNTRKKHKERLDIFPTINTVQARNKSKVIAAEVLEGKSSSQIRRGKQTELSVKELMEEFVRARLKQPKYKPSTQKRWGHFNNAWIYKKTADKEIRTMFAKSKIDIGSMSLSEVNMDNLREFHRFVGSKAQNSANTLIEMLSVIFNYAAEKNYISQNPVKFKTEDLFLKHEDNRRLTRSQMDSVLDRTRKYDERSKSNPRINLDYYKAKRLRVVPCTVIAFALSTPRRYRGEGAALRWDQISFHEKKIFYGDSKVGQKEYKLGPKALKLLKAIKNERFNKDSPFTYPPEDPRSQYVFPSANFGKINNVGKINTKPYMWNIRKTWKAILKSLNIKYIPMYNCRHSVLTDSLSKTKSIPIVGEMAGHSKKSGYKQTLRYARVLDEDIEKALLLIDGEEQEESKVIQFNK
jgi:integrase